MSVSVLTVTIDKIDDTQSLLYVFGTLGIAAGDYAAGGLVVNLVSAQIPVSSDSLIEFHAESQPLVANKTTSTYVYNFLKGTTPALGQLQIFTGAAAQSALAELADGATPAAVVADRIRFRAVFNRL